MLRAKFISPAGLFGSSIFPQSAPSKIISRALGLTPARSSRINNGTPVHSAFRDSEAPRSAQSCRREVWVVPLVTPAVAIYNWKSKLYNSDISREHAKAFGVLYGGLSSVGRAPQWH